MTLAEDYAQRQALMKAQDAATNASAPPEFHCPTCDANVEPDGICRITPGPGQGIVTLSQVDASKLRDWITATFT